MTLSLRTQISIKTKYGRGCFISFSGFSDQEEHLAIVFGQAEQQSTPLVRVHSECLTGDVFGSQHCDCGEQLDLSMNMLSKQGGILLYMRQEGRGIGLYNKLDAYDLQLNQGMNTYEANHALGFPDDLRHFAPAAQMLEALGVSHIKLLTNNPDKVTQLEDNGITIREIAPLQTQGNAHNTRYLSAKKDAGHLL